MQTGESPTKLQKLMQNHHGDSVFGRLTDQRFDETHEAFESSSNQQSLILNWLTHFTRKHFEDSSSIRMLSAGCGSGILDIPLLQAIAGSFANISYTAFDPNATACERFRLAFQSLGESHVDLEVLETTVDQIREGRPAIEQRFDMVHAVHCLYYFDDPSLDILALDQLLAPGGQMVIVQAPKAELNQLADCFWSGHFEENIWYSTELQAFLREKDFTYHQHRIDASVDVTACFDHSSPVGQSVLDFILQTRSTDLAAETRKLVLEFLHDISVRDEGRILAPHPADVFVIAK